MTLGIEREGLAEPLRESSRARHAGARHVRRADHARPRAPRADGHRVPAQRLRAPDALLRGRPRHAEAGTVRAVFIRAPWIAEHGPGVEVLAEVDGHPVAARRADAGVAFHPELGGTTGCTRRSSRTSRGSRRRRRQPRREARRMAAARVSARRGEPAQAVRERPDACTAVRRGSAALPVARAPAACRCGDRDGVAAHAQWPACERSATGGAALERARSRVRAVGSRCALEPSVCGFARVLLGRPRRASSPRRERRRCLRARSVSRPALGEGDRFVARRTRGAQTTSP